LARAVILALKSEKQNQSYLISDGVSYDKEYLGEVIKAVLKKKTLKLKLPSLPLRLVISLTEKIYSLFGKRPFLNTEKFNEISSANWKCESEEIWNDIHSSPQFTLTEAMRETIEWYKENGLI
jgi:nucleoside-diphosphate-sugar epimerase